ncbi:MAG: trigger factor [Candidatus Berkelbacteria bacterium Licking1014_7]|uniref:Trigger factor n=1 Tax=Candidatus Berkelbacteria bacterium Licking1014_7 TaxID=2017147 RepID=A0A554LJN3_9BACT|nr:MAG: trigger factor [Candidatus Berkelbacteria bacterium Licking1014_7]
MWHIVVDWRDLQWVQYMKIKITQQKEAHKLLTVLVEAKDLTGYFQKVYERVAPEVEIKGFRPGKAPQRLIIEEVGLARISQDVLDMALRGSLGKAIEQEKLAPVIQPKINLKKWTFNPLDNSKTDILEFESEIIEKPKVILGDYTKIKVKSDKKMDISVNEQDVQKVLEKLQNQKAKMTDTLRPCKKGDFVEIDFTGKIDNVTQEKLTSPHYPFILGEGAFIDGFENNIIGLKKDESKHFALELPKNFSDKMLAGKIVYFEVKVLQVKEIELADLNDSFAGNFGHNKLSDLKEAIKKSVELEKKQQAERALEVNVLEQALKLLKVKIPDALIQEEVNRQVDNISRNLSRQGLTLEKYLPMIKKTSEEFRKDLSPQAKKNIEIGLLLGEVIKREGWESADKEAIKKAVRHLIAIATKTK